MPAQVHDWNTRDLQLLTALSSLYLQAKLHQFKKRLCDLIMIKQLALACKCGVGLMLHQLKGHDFNHGLWN